MQPCAMVTWNVGFELVGILFLAVVLMVIFILLVERDSCECSASMPLRLLAASWQTAGALARAPAFRFYIYIFCTELNNESVISN